MWPIANITSTVMLGLGTVLLTAILVRRSLRHSRGTQRGVPRYWPGHSQPNRDRPVPESPDDRSRWQVEMHELARDLKGELDSKMTSLQILTRLAREECERLEAALARAEQLQTHDRRQNAAPITPDKHSTDEQGPYPG